MTLPLQLQQPRFVAHHPIGTHHTLLLQPEHFVQLPRRGPPPVIIQRRSCRPRIAPVVLGQILLVEIAVGLRVAGDPVQPQLLYQPVLMRAMCPLHTPLGLWRVGRDDTDPQVVAHATELRQRRHALLLLRLRRLAHIHVLPVRVQGPRNPVLVDPAPQHPCRRPDRLLGIETPLRRGGRVIDHVHQAAAFAALLQPLVKAAVQLHQLAEMRPPLAPLTVRLTLAHPLLSACPQPPPQRFGAHRQALLAQVLGRQRRTEVGVLLPIPPQRAFPELLPIATVRLAPAAQVTQPLRASVPKPHPHSLRLTVTQPHQLRRFHQLQVPRLHSPKYLYPI